VIWQLIGGAELGLLVLAGLAIRGLLRLLRSDAVDLRPEQLAELEQELAAVPLAEVIRRAEQVAVREFAIDALGPVRIEPGTGNRYFTAPAGSAFTPACDDCEWSELRALTGTVTRYRYPCERHARDQIEIG
jgi:hypothetical protein